MKDLTIVYYTANYLDKTNPYFLENTKKQLVKAIGDLPLIVVSQKPVKPFEGYSGDFSNIVVGDIGRSHLNIYRQILWGAEKAKTKYVAMAEDDILYSESHFHSRQIETEAINNPDTFLYDMNKVSLFTWTKPPMFSFRSKRKVVNQLIAPTKMLVESLRERFDRVEELKRKGKTEEQIIKCFGDPGRYENLLGVTPRKSFEFYSQSPSIVFSHEHAFGYLSQGSKKRLGDIRIVELADWGRAEDILKLYERS
jgi:hypothetical protein